MGQLRALARGSLPSLPRAHARGYTFFRPLRGLEYGRAAAAIKERLHICQRWANVATRQVAA